MGIDLSQFMNIFFEESREGLELLERGLLTLDESSDPEVINEIFRAAHSIKGGSGTFGLDDIASFTHVMETVLNEMRDGRRPITKGDADVLLHSVDCLREMLSAAQEGHEIDATKVAVYQAELDALLSPSCRPSVTSKPPSPHFHAPVVEGGWHISFAPYLHLMKCGNDPLRIFWALEELGDLAAYCETSRLPGLENLDPEACYLAWTLDLKGGSLQREDISDLFEWVEDDCDLVIEQHSDCDSASGEVVPREGLRSSDRAEDEQSLPTGQQEPGVAQSSLPGASEVGVAISKAGSSNSIRVDIDKIDNLVNIVGELVITQSMLATLGDGFTMDRLQRLREGLAQLERHTREVQQSVMRIRMLPISVVFGRIPRSVRDLSGKLGKQVELVISGESTELDKSVIERVGDPLTHLVRNALDHGIEDPQTRIAAGKPAAGKLALDAFHQGGNIYIQIKDDGAGLNRERIMAKAIERGLVREGDELPDNRVYELIMQPGFSTAQQVSDVSGRGVGLDVVSKNVYALGGTIGIDSAQGQGSTFTIRLPLTLAILDGQMVSVGDEVYIVPLLSVIESLQIEPGLVTQVASQGAVYKLRDEFIPFVRLATVFGVAKPRAKRLEDGLLVVVEFEGRKIGLFVDELLGQQQVVIKSLETNFRRVEGASGATILGDGSVALILDIQSLLRLAERNRCHAIQGVMT